MHAILVGPMKANALTIGKSDSSVIVVDPLHDFADKDGIFSQCYGIDTTKPVRQVCEYLQTAVKRLRFRAHVTLCRSKYENNQFGIRGLENLCTTDEGSTSIIDPTFFDLEVRKIANSILSAGEPVEQLLNERETIVMTGVTTTSCIGMSIDEMRIEKPKITIVIPRNAVASRVDRRVDEDALFQKWIDDTSGKIIVVDGLQKITFM